ncbi:14765_t:CDS:2 [Dentiscutata erythropus]|uniref:14765_t:CDS:1 n=1 Tax=Dentiscutata erythropus TaxID=1348616 RepID=A0A9N9AAC4_9GLOM|nr:14765_t:CDS:2 [Dentiscutata erythropus]
MPFNTSSIPWEALNTINTFNTCDMTCIVEPSLGLLLIIGGTHPPEAGFQVYNFTSNAWNEIRNLINYSEGFGLIFQPRSILIEPKIILIWGGLTGAPPPIRVIYKLNMTSSKILNCVGIARSREGVFIFGGVDKDIPIIEKGEGASSGLSYIYNITESRIVQPSYQLPFNFTHSVVGVIGDFMHIIVLSYNDYLEDKQISIIPFNFARFKFESPVVTSTNLTKARLRAAGVQPPGSDVVLIYGGVIYQNSSAPETGITLDTMLVYNMTLRSWTDTVNLVTDASAYNFEFSNTINTLSSPINTSQWPIAAIGLTITLAILAICIMNVMIFLIKKLKKLKSVMFMGVYI